MCYVFVLVFIVISYILSFFITAFIRYYAVKSDFLDIPNARSSHIAATPKGGGAGFVLIFLIAAVFLAVTRQIPYRIAVAFAGGGIAVFFIGLRDDYKHVNILVRLLVHFFAAAWAVYWLNGNPSLNIIGMNLGMGFIGNYLCVAGIVWLINLYNFMDGIDGIAALQAIIAAGFIGMLFIFNGMFNMALLLWVLAASVAGFLFWNWPAARIFMGDAGSSFLGFAFGVFIVFTMKDQTLSAWPWFIIFGIFFIDTIITLFTRILRGAYWYRAHCCHAYQHAARNWGHLKVIFVMALLQIFWLVPLACLSWFYINIGFLLTISAFIPIIFLSVYLKAGREPDCKQGGFIEQS